MSTASLVLLIMGLGSAGGLLIWALFTLASKRQRLEDTINAPLASESHRYRICGRKTLMCVKCGDVIYRIKPDDAQADSLPGRCHPTKETK